MCIWNSSWPWPSAITLDVLTPTASITLNAVDMTFANAWLAASEGARAIPLTPQVSTDIAAQTATFTFSKPLTPGRYTLTTDYTGKIGTQANGLFAIDYDTKTGKKRALYTQFENSDARKFMPSWDEPNHKATFTLTATVPAAPKSMSSGWAAKQSTRSTRCLSGLNGLCAGAWAVKESALALLDFCSGLREYFEEVADDAEVRNFEHRRFGVLVHGHDDLGRLHAGLLLDGAGDPC